MILTPGQAVVETLNKEGIEYLFGVVGSQFLGLLDALYAREDIKFLGTRHEQAAAFMADGYARVLGRPGACVATGGPGAANLVTGVAAAHFAHSPVIALAGTTAMAEQYRGAVQELDHLALFRPITKLALSINKAERAPELVRHGIRVAMSSRRGPVFIEMPRDVFADRPLDVQLPDTPAYRDTAGGQRADGSLVEEAAGLLLNARRPVIISGGGVSVSNATDEVVQLADLLGIPLVATYARLDTVPNDHPLYLGPMGRAGAPEAGEIVSKADVVLAIGTRLSQFTTSYDNRYITAQAQLIQIDIESREMGLVFPVTVGLIGDARAVMAQLLAAVQRRDPATPLNSEWTEEARQISRARWQRLEDEGRLDAIPIKPQRVYYEMRKVLPRDAIVTVDAGAVSAYGYDRLAFHQPGNLIAPRNFAGLGFAYPEALGAKLAAPQRPVVAIHGDGGFLFNSQELETAVREHIPVVCVVMNNGAWGSEKAYQDRVYNGRYVGADITNPRFDKLAELFGAKGFYVDRPEDVAGALEEALKLDVTSVIEVPVDPQELPYPFRLL